MKRSEINRAIASAEEDFRKVGYVLRPCCRDRASANTCAGTVRGKIITCPNANLAFSHH
jgi:hypothetical protein